MKGVTTDAISATSPLGKLCAPPPWKKSFGLFVSLGRLREKARFNTMVVPALRTIASNDWSKVRPRSVAGSGRMAVRDNGPGGM